MLVTQACGDERQHHHRKAAEDADRQNQGPGVMQLRACVTQEVGAPHEAEREDSRHDPGAEDYLLRLVPDDLTQRCAHDVVLLLHLFEDRGFFDIEPHVQAMIISTALNRKGTRQPHVMKVELFSPIVRLAVRKTRLLRTSPVPTPSWVNMPDIPLLAGGAYSAVRRAAPAHSPPTANPWSSRKVKSSNGARIPMEVALGTKPSPTVDKPMINSVAIRVFLRPRRSPK